MSLQKPELLKKLEARKGKLFLYQTEEYRIINCKINDATADIVTDKRWFVIPLDKLDRFISELLPVEESIIPENASLVLGTKEVTSMKDVILESISKLQTDPSYVKQANAINQSVNTLINCAKISISLHKMKG